MMRITKDYAEFVDLEAAIFVSDDLYMTLLNDREARVELLDSLDVDSIIVDRTGEEVVPGKVFETISSPATVPEYKEAPEVGYHHKL